MSRLRKLLMIKRKHAVLLHFGIWLPPEVDDMTGSSKQGEKYSSMEHSGAENGYYQKCV